MLGRALLAATLALASGLDYDQRIDSTLNTTRLFTLLKDSLEDSSVADSIWPTQYSVISGAVEEGGQITETIEHAASYTYTISNVSTDADPFHLNYSPVEGAGLVGNSMIEVLEKEGGAYIRWYGHYDLSWYQPTYWVTEWYIGVFFPAMAENIKKFEVVQGAGLQSSVGPAMPLPTAAREALEVACAAPPLAHVAARWCASRLA